MTFTSFYPWIKALHVASALIFFGGVMTVTAFLWATTHNLAATKSIAAAIRRWDRMVTIPAMFLVWTFGLGLAFYGHWLSAVWLNIKFILVILLSAIHGIQSGRLRGLIQGLPPRSLRTIPFIVMISAMGIAILAVLKPS